MLSDLKKGSSLYRPSNFWVLLNKDHIEKISTSGLDNFKRSVNLRYFSWGIVGIVVHGMHPILYAIRKGNWKPFLSGKFENYNNNLGVGVKRLNFLTAYIYKTYVCCLFDYVKTTDEFNVFDKLNEPKIGNPFVISYKGKHISQDLCNSIHEFNSVMNSLDRNKISSVAELGGGYGRTAYVFLKMLPKINYTVIDIPPALYIAQWYLSKLFSKEKIFYYRKFKAFSAVRKDFEKARIRFLMADQIRLLPKKYVNLFINISSLHEMRRNQIKNYLNEINRVCKGYFYTKQWYRSFTSDNLHIKQEEYPVFKSWKLLFSRYPHPIQRWFFDTLYKIN